MTNAIEITALGKKYTLQHQREKYYALRDSLTKFVKNPLSFRTSRQEEFWALKNINLTVKRGEVLGIIGKNGSGKSTLLKILSKITRPSAGRAVINGRVASLLEVGTGLHPELTGRENIFLCGAILGMKRTEIISKFDNIVEFAGIEKFLDTPVKHYSSGMHVRLGFSVAAHLEPDILLVDEVLAVGDAEFQKKCLGKMQDVTKNEGRTVLFVSHNMGSIIQLCNRCIWLKDGKIYKHGLGISTITQQYLSHIMSLAKTTWINKKNKYNNRWFTPLRIFLTNNLFEDLTTPINRNSEVWINIEGFSEEVNSALTIGYALYTIDGTLLYWSYHTDQGKNKWPTIKNGLSTIRSLIPVHLLNEGLYTIELIGGLHFSEWLFEPQHSNPSISLTVEGDFSVSPHWLVKRPGLLAPEIEWKN